MSRLVARRRLLAGLALGLALSVTARPAAAHAILVESSPAAGATVTGPALAIALRYNSRIDKARSRITLFRPDKTQAVLPIDQGGAEDLLTTRADLEPGVYRLRWQVLAIDGHITRGDVSFTVAAPVAP